MLAPTTRSAQDLHSPLSESRSTNQCDALYRPSLSICVGSRSDRGYYRQQNEDCCLALEERGIVLVADGVGGHLGGARASHTVARVLFDWLSFATKCIRPTRKVIETIVADAVEAARHEMLDVADSELELNQMATTVVAGVVLGDSFYLTHVGDCRAYLLRRGCLRRLTKDQTFVQVAIDAGLLTDESARNHPWRHMITNCVGIKPLDEPIGVDEISIQSGDRLVLCSDGLTGVVDDELMMELLMMDSSAQAVADALVNTALELDSHDNVTCVVADVIDARS